jgi:hypothetical protein
VFSAGDRLPVGVEVFPGMEPNDLMLWFESRRALVAGDTLLDRGQGLEIPWPPPEQVGGAAAQGQILEALLPVLELRSSWCSRRTGRPATGPRSSERSPDAGPG